MISVFSLGILTIAVPVQIHQLTGSVLQVSFAVALDGVGMFGGLLVGGVLADRFDRRSLILMARGLCGLGFLALALNGFLAAPSLTALYLMSFWDGFFGAVGITALMASTPALVGRENLAAAGALSMLTVRFGAVMAPMVGGLVIASGGVVWNYLIAGLGTLATLIPLVRLPSLRPEPAEPQHPLKAMLGGFSYLLENRIVGAVIAIGTLQAMLSAIRVLFPSLADAAGASGFEIGLLYSAVPLGAMIGAFTSGWVGCFVRPGLLAMASLCACALLIAMLGLSGVIAPMLIILVLFGYFGSITSLLQFILVQSNTPDAMIGRISGLWSAQDVIGDSGGALIMGGLARVLAPFAGLFWFGVGSLAAGAAMLAGFGRLRGLRVEPLSKPDVTIAEKALADQGA
jgi:ENTS family enterobactin (siderophore) exporter